MKLSRKACAAALAATLSSILPSALLAQNSIPPINETNQGTIQAQYGLFKGPKINVLDTDFAGGADPTGAQDSTSAVQAAFSYAQSLASSSSAAPVLYFPRGQYKGTFTFLNNGTNSVSIEGDGSGVTELLPQNTSGVVLDYQAAGTAIPYGHTHVSDLTIWGLGHLSSADLLEVNNTNNMDVHNVVLGNTAGTCISVEGSSERNQFDNLELPDCRTAIKNSGNSNENYYRNYHIFQPGEDAGKWSWNVNANPSTGVLPASGTQIPDYHAAVSVSETQNVHFENGSIKGSIYQGCFQFFGTNGFSVKHTYCEAYTTPGLNPSLQVGGQAPLGHLTTALTATSTTATLDDGIYWPGYFGLQADALLSSYSRPVYIMPPDYQKSVAGVTSPPSSLCSGVANCTITTGTYETATLQAVWGANAGGAAANVILTRGSSSLAWPAGAVLARPHIGDDGDGTSAENHWNGVLGVDANHTSGVNDTVLGTGSWVFTPARATSEIIVGPVYDGYTALTNGGGYSPDGSQHLATLHTSFDEFYTGNAAVGEGIILVPLNGEVIQDNACLPPQDAYPSFGTNPTNLFSTYSNGSCNAFFPTYADHSMSNAFYTDTSAGAFVQPADHSFQRRTYQLNALAGTEFYGGYTIHDTGAAGTPTVDLILNGYPNSPSSLGAFFPSTNQYSLLATASQVTANVPLAAQGGVINSINGYTTATSYIMPAGQQYVQFNPSAAATLTLPPLTTGEEFVINIPQANTQQITLTAPSGAIYVNGASVGATYKISSFVGSLLFETDGANYQLLTPIGYTGSCASPKAPVYTNGVVTACQ